MDHHASLVLGETDFFSANNVILPNQSSLYGPKDVTFDKSGNLWVSDTQANRIIEFLPPFKNDENASVAIGAINLTSFAYRNESQVGLDSPTGLAFDSSGSLWVADAQNDRVLEFPNVASSITTTSTASVQSSPISQSTIHLSSSFAQVSTKTTTAHSVSTSVASATSSPTSSATSLSLGAIVYIAVAVVIVMMVTGVAFINRRKLVPRKIE